MIQYFAKPYGHFVGNVKFELDLLQYTKMSDVKKFNRC